jgi:hypothetical protein
MTDRTADLAIDMAAEVVRLRGLIDRILRFSDFTAQQQASIRREAGITND